VGLKRVNTGRDRDVTQACTRACVTHNSHSTTPCKQPVRAMQCNKDPVYCHRALFLTCLWILPRGCSSAPARILRTEERPSVSGKCMIQSLRSKQRRHNRIRPNQKGGTDWGTGRRSCVARTELRQTDQGRGHHRLSRSRVAIHLCRHETRLLVPRDGTKATVATSSSSTWGLSKFIVLLATALRLTVVGLLVALQLVHELYLHAKNEHEACLGIR
jgi:hypothetical protein